MRKLLLFLFILNLSSFYSQKNDTIYIVDTIWISVDSLDSFKSSSLDKSNISNSNVISPLNDNVDKMFVLDKIDNMKKISFFSLIGLAFQVGFSQNNVVPKTYWDSIYKNRIHLDGSLGFQHSFKTPTNREEQKRINESFSQNGKIRKRTLTGGVNVSYNINSKYSIKTGIMFAKETIFENFRLNSSDYAPYDQSIDFEIKNKLNMGNHLIIPLNVERRFFTNKNFKYILAFDFGGVFNKSFKKELIKKQSFKNSNNTGDLYYHHQTRFNGYNMSFFPEVGFSYIVKHKRALTKIRLAYQLSPWGLNYIDYGVDDIIVNEAVYDLWSNSTGGLSTGEHSFKIIISQSIYTGMKRLKKKSK